MKKKALLERLEGHRYGEEAAVQVYIQHLKTVLGRCGLSEERIATIRRLMDTMTGDTQQHERLLANLVDEVKRMEKDDF